MRSWTWSLLACSAVVAGCGGDAELADARQADGRSSIDAAAVDARPADGPPAPPGPQQKVCLDGLSGKGTTVAIDDAVTMTGATLELWYRSSAPAGSNRWHAIAGFHPAAYVGEAYPGLGIDIADATTLNMSPLTGRVIQLVVDARGGPQGQLNARGFDLDATHPGFDEREWHHYAVVLDGATQRLFVDGAELTSTHQRDGAEDTTFASAFGPDFASVFGSLYLSVGYMARDSIRYTEGAFTDLRVSRVARYTSDFTPTFRLTADADTVVLLPMNEADGAVSFDASEHGHDLTWSGGFSRSSLLLGCP